jgi:adenosine deaminase/aminodeoxyfutalosine deaminase
MRLLAPPTIASAPQRRNSGTQHSDDPPIFGSNLLEEYILVQQLCEFSLDQMRELAANAVKASFLPPTQKLNLLARIEQYR